MLKAEIGKPEISAGLGVIISAFSFQYFSICLSTFPLSRFLLSVFPSMPSCSTRNWKSALRGQDQDASGPGCRRKGDKKTRDLHRAFLVQPNRRNSAGGEVAAVKPAQLHRAEQCAEHEQGPRHRLGNRGDRKVIYGKTIIRT
jgi:hypothetical protein